LASIINIYIIKLKMAERANR